MVDPSEVSAMKQLIEMMNAGQNLDAPEPVASDLPVSYDYDDAPGLNSYVAESIDAPAITSTSIVTPETEAMKRILMAFQGAQSEAPTERLQQRAKMDRPLREALMTEPTKKGVRVGSWEIEVMEGEGGLKSYNVTNVKTGEPIATDLTLYDAAKGLVSHLNEGHSITTREVRDILNTEAAYARARDNAAQYQRSMKLAEGRGDYTKASVMEARFDEALARAKEARRHLAKIV